MPFDPSRDPPADPLVSRPRRAPPALVVAGVAGACVLGAGLGLWARPSAGDGELSARRTASAPPATSPRQIEIRVDRFPPPAAEPAPTVEGANPPATTPEPGPAPEPLAPKRSPEGLVKVRATAPERLVDVQEIAARKAAERRARAEGEARKAKAERAARADAEAAALRARKAKARVADAAEAKARAKAERRLAERRVAEQRAAKKAAAERRQARLAAGPKAAQRPAEQKRKAGPAAEARTARAAKAAPRCASPDPGAALACSDPALGAAERQLARAYRRAEAAGVPLETLERQQRRWLAARANAALRAPWAVHDIYLARIAELHDQTRQASRDE